MTVLLRLLLAFLTALLPAVPSGPASAPSGRWLSAPVEVPTGTRAEVSVPAPTAAIGSAMTGTAASVTYEGTLSYVGARFGSRYLALPEKVGTRARICGPSACISRVSTDFGPDQRVHPDRIADLSAHDFLLVCGVPLSFGLCPGTVTLAGSSLPETDKEPVQ